MYDDLRAHGDELHSYGTIQAGMCGCLTRGGLATAWRQAVKARKAPKSQSRNAESERAAKALLVHGPHAFFDDIANKLKSGLDAPQLPQLDIRFHNLSVSVELPVHRGSDGTGDPSFELPTLVNVVKQSLRGLVTKKQQQQLQISGQDSATDGYVLAGSPKGDRSAGQEPTLSRAVVVNVNRAALRERHFVPVTL
ncbi:hypothetical protein PybrP1_006891, partial [[Pythium] brassicae (nom. inval.)]